jgi:large repetitive protein
MHPIHISPCVTTGTQAALGIKRASRTTGAVSRHSGVLRALIGLSSVLVIVSCGDDPTDPIGPISIETPSLAEAIEGLGYNQQLQAVGGIGGYSWGLAGGSLPAGLALAPSGAISGTPVAPGTSDFRVRATDTAGRTATADLALFVVQALELHTGALPDGVAGEVYAAQLQAVGGRGARTWSVSGGDAASWLSVSSTGQLSGAPTGPGAFTVTVAVADESGQRSTRELPIVVLSPLAVGEIHLPAAIQGRVYAAQLVATGGDGVYTWALESGALPMGIVLGSVGDLIGIPEESGVFAFTAQVTDRADRIATRVLTLAVERAPTIQTSSLPPGAPGEPYVAQLVATGGTGTYTWRVTDGALPQGLTLSAGGTVSGSPTALGSAVFTIQVMDEASATHTRAFTIEVAQVQALVNGVPTVGIEGDAGEARYYSIEVPSGASRLTVSISGGTGDVDLYVRRGALPRQYVYDCRPLRQGNEETCTFTPPFLAAGHWYIMLRGYMAYEGVSLVANHDG